MEDLILVSQFGVCYSSVYVTTEICYPNQEYASEFEDDNFGSLHKSFEQTFLCWNCVVNF